ncbi:MAG: response regulator transcription factor [Candidatus Poribacteria bacterium]|nr:response regulator transcription factor [Candidatus Poribacteria bacterium]
MKVLIANHIHVIRNGLRDILQSQANLEFVGFVETGYQLERHCLQLNPHVVILCSSLPGPSLPNLIDNMNSSCPNTRILIFSSQSEDIDLHHLVEKGARGCVVQEESNLLISCAIQTVGSGATWFSNCCVEHLIRPRKQESDHSLTHREVETVKLLVAGLTNREIAHALNVKNRTVEFHLNNVFQKLDMNNRVSVAIWAKENILKA